MTDRTKTVEIGYGMKNARFLAGIEEDCQYGFFNQVYTTETKHFES